MSPLTLSVWILTCLIWSTVWLFIKLGVTDVPPVAFAVFRMAVALLLLVPILLVRRTPLPRARRDWALIAGTGVILLGLNYGLLNWGLQFISSGLTAVLQAMTPVFGFVFAHFLLGDEKMTRPKGIALVVGVLGVATIFSDQIEARQRGAVAGSAAVLGGAVCVAFAYVVMRRGGMRLHPSAITTGQLAAAIIPLSIYSAVVEGPPLSLPWTRTAVLSGIYLAAAGSVAAAWMNYWLLKRVGATKLLSMGLVEPLIAVALGAVFLGEQMTVRTVVGGVCVLLSVAVVLDLRPAPASGPEAS
jgi:drug/metabolite transporter (DMT)-like permease